MPRACSVCTDPRVSEIDAALASGKSVPQIAREFGLHESNTYRHRKDHLTLVRSMATHSRPAGVAATVERLEQIDLQLGDVYSIAVRRGHTQAAVAVLAQRIKLVMEVASLRDEIQPKQKQIVHVHCSDEQAERIASSYLKHKQLTAGNVIDAKVKRQ